MDTNDSKEIYSEKTTLPKLWLVERRPAERFRLNPKFEIPPEDVKALAAVFSGSTDHAQRVSVFDLLKQICARKLRLACDCNANGANRPEISCRSYHGGQSFGLAKMPNNEKRPDHSTTCPFNRQVRIRIDTAKRGVSSEFDYSGRFALPVILDVVQEPSGQSQSSPARHYDYPKLMRMFAKLMDAAGFSLSLIHI